MKLCMACAYFKPDPNAIIDHCMRRTIADPVRGTSTYASCSIERAHDLPGCCGRDGKNFVAKVESMEGHRSEVNA